MAMLKRPRRVLMMVPAGAAVDSASRTSSALQPGDILIDGGNSWFLDTERRSKELAASGFHYLGTGVSAASRGRCGPRDHARRAARGVDALAPVLRAIAAKADDGEPCVDYMGPGGAGHYVKMVHNGIEYGDMQLIAEAYDLLARGLRVPARELSTIFQEWNAGDLRSYLVEITAEVLARTDRRRAAPRRSHPRRGAAEGTGKWTSQHAFDVGAPIPTINAAVESRILSALKAERVHASRILRGPSPHYHGKKERLVDAVRAALYASKVTSYAQGFGLLKMASRMYGYNLQPVNIARIWRAGASSEPRFSATSWRRISATPPGEPAARRCVPAGHREPAGLVAVRDPGRGGNGDPAPAMSASLAYFDALPQRAAARQPDAGAAGLLRRAHVPAHRPAGCSTPSGSRRGSRLMEMTRWHKA